MTMPDTNVFGEAAILLNRIQTDHPEYLGETATEAVEDAAILLRNLAMDWAGGTLLTAHDDEVMCARSDEHLDPGAAGHDWTEDEWAEWSRRSRDLGQRP